MSNFLTLRILFHIHKCSILVTFLPDDGRCLSILHVGISHTRQQRPSARWPEVPNLISVGVFSTRLAEPAVVARRICVTKEVLHDAEASFIAHCASNDPGCSVRRGGGSKRTLFRL